MTWSDWLLSLHLLSAVAFVGAMAAFWALVFATRGAATWPAGLPEAFSRPVTAALVLGMAGTVIFGIWLAIDLDAYHPWDPWIVASLVLWAVASGLSDRSGRAFVQANLGGPDAAELRRRGVQLHGASSAAALVILILMIWKPGA